MRIPANPLSLLPGFLAMLICSSAVAGAGLPRPTVSVPARAAGSHHGTLRIKITTGTYVSDGHRIPFERFSPVVAAGKRMKKPPVIVLVHGADGLTIELWSEGYRQYAGRLAAAGYDVMFPHYFDRTGTKVADLGTIVRNFVVWMKTISDAATYAIGQPGVQPGHYGLMGFSLGASIALTLASQDRRVPVVVEYFGAMPDLAVPYMKRMPPTLILHGDADWLVSVKEAYKLESLLKRKRVPYHMHIYPGQGHGFMGDAAADSIRRATDFFRKYLIIGPVRHGQIPPG